MPGRARSKPMFDVRRESDDDEAGYPGYYGGPDEPDRDPPPRRGGAGARNGLRVAPPAGGQDEDDHEPLYARDYAPQGYDGGDPDDPPLLTHGGSDEYDEYDDGEYDEDDEYEDSEGYDDAEEYDEDEDDEYDDEDDFDDDEYGVGDGPLAVPPPGSGGRPLGPADVEELDPSMTDALARVDLGSIHVPVPFGAELKLEDAQGGRPQAVHLMLPEGRIAVSALAAPRSSGLWAELADEIETSLRGGGARVRNVDGDWGRELHASTDNACSVFIGADGPRWMVYGVATAPQETLDALDVELRRVLRGTIVVRGKLPYPPRTVLPVSLPEDRSAAVDEEPRKASITVSVPAVTPTGSGSPARPAGTPSTDDESAAGRVAANGGAGATGAAPAARGPVNGAPRDDRRRACGPGPVRPGGRPASMPPAADGRPVRPVDGGPVRPAADGGPSRTTQGRPAVRGNPAGPVRNGRPGLAADTGAQRDARPRADATPPSASATQALPTVGPRPGGRADGPAATGSERPEATPRTPGAPDRDRRAPVDGRRPDDRERFDQRRVSDDRRPGGPERNDRTGGFAARSDEHRFDENGFAPDRVDPDRFDGAGYEQARPQEDRLDRDRFGGSRVADERFDRDRFDGDRFDGDRFDGDRRLAEDRPDRDRFGEPVGRAVPDGGASGRPGPDVPPEPPARRDPAVTALSGAATFEPQVPIPSTPAAQHGPDSGDRSSGRRRAADRPWTDGPAGRPVAAGADAPNSADPSVDRDRRVGDRWTGDRPADPTPRAEPVDPVRSLSRMAIEDIPLGDVPLLDATLDRAPTEPPAVPDREGASELPRRHPDRTRRSEDRPPDTDRPGRRHRDGGSAPAAWMSAEVAARPSGRHSRPQPDADPLGVDGSGNGNGASSAARPDLWSSDRWRAGRREPDGTPSEGDLFRSPAEAGERYRRNGHDRSENGGRRRAADPDDRPDETPQPQVDDVRDPGRHRRG